MRTRVALALVVLFTALVPVWVSASHVDVVDADDTRGPLDIRRVDVRGETRPTWKVTTWSRWTVQKIWDRGYVLVYLDTFGTTRYDYYALVRSNGYRMNGVLFRDRLGKPDRRISRLRTWRANRRSVSVRVPLTKVRIGERRRHYSWYVQTLMTSKRCRRVCFDRAPDAVGVIEPLPDATPTPTPTSTPTP